MNPEDLINEKQVITQSDHTLVGRPINIHNHRLKKLANYVSYRKGGVKCGKPLNILEAFAVQILELHASDLREERFWNNFHKGLDIINE